MINDYLIVHKSLLPDFIFDVIEAKKIVDKGKMSVSEACKLKNISRSTFYKYKDYVFLPSKDKGHKIIIGVWIEDIKGTLSTLLRQIAHLKGNIVAINQDTPINNIAYVTLSIDSIEVVVDSDEFLGKLREVHGIKTVNLIAIE